VKQNTATPLRTIIAAVILCGSEATWWGPLEERWEILRATAAKVITSANADALSESYNCSC